MAGKLSDARTSFTSSDCHSVIDGANYSGCHLNGLLSMHGTVIKQPCRLITREPFMSKTVLIGKAKELYVATLLVAKHLHVYFPLVDNGFDLLVTSSDGSKFLPVQVKYKNSRRGCGLKRADAKKFKKCNAVLAFGSDTAEPDDFYFFPAKEWASKAKDRARGKDRARRDDMLFVYLAKNQNKEWAKKFIGKPGIDLAFKSVLAKP